VPLSRTGAELLFEVFSQRYERGSTLVTSNLPRRVDDQILVADRPAFEPHSRISRVPAPNDGDRRYASKRGARSDMDKAAIDIAKRW
jgi:IstB-like ATP binding protein